MTKNSKSNQNGDIGGHSSGRGLKTKTYNVVVADYSTALDQSSMLELFYFVCGKWTWAVSTVQWAGPDPGARSSGAFIADSNFF